MKKVSVVTGAAGFLGYSITKYLVDNNYDVYAIVRPESEHNKRLADLDLKKIIELDISQLPELINLIDEKCDFFFHLTWIGSRYDIFEQKKNIDYSISAVEAATKLGCKKIIISGSQAEYGVKDCIINEETSANPRDAYGASKLAALYLTKLRAKQLGIEWVWGRIFSLYGDYEPISRMLPQLIHTMYKDEEMTLSSCTQYWDYLNVKDGAAAMVSLAERGRDGEIYNIARGDYKQLSQFVDEVNDLVGRGKVVFGDKADPYFSLQPDVSKLIHDTGWEPKISFNDGVREYIEKYVKL